jgi:DNA-binding transcriptional MerR regulator
MKQDNQGGEGCMLRIGEFSALSSISINMLRHYDKIGLLVPEHIDQMNGYRYYDKEQLLQSNRIVALKTMGFGLEEIKEAKSMNQSEIKHLLQNKLQSKKEEAHLIQNQVAKITEALQMEHEEEEYALSVVTKKIPEMWVVSYRGKISDFPEEGLLWQTLMEECEKQRIKVSESSTAMAVNHGMNDEKNYMDVEVQLSIEKLQQCHGKIKIYKLPECEAASIVFQGSYNKISSINTFVAKWMENNQYEISGEVFSIYHNSPRECRSEKNYITELCFPISKKSIDSRIV